MKIVTIIGARPQFIKAAALSRVLKQHQEIQEIIIHTGQHFDANMSQVFFSELDIPEPDYNLEVAGLSHGAMTGRMLEKIEQVLLDEKPDLVMVYGDTNSTLAGALAAVKLRIPVAHIEAGLRSFNRQMPEEINRILTDHASDLLFCPTKTAVENLRREGFTNIVDNGNLLPLSPAPSRPRSPAPTVLNVGDVMQDAAMFYADRAVKPKAAPEKPFVLATLHRAENTDDPQRLEEILRAMAKISKELSVILPLHPRTRNKIVEAGITISGYSKLQLIDPVGYLEVIWLLKHCLLVMTDSGGLQKEAYFFKKPCITLRDETEWTELVDAGVNMLAGANRNRILDTFKRMIDAQPDFSEDLYGGGSACERIARVLVQGCGGKWGAEEHGSERE